MKTRREHDRKSKDHLGASDYNRTGDGDGSDQVGIQRGGGLRGVSGKLLSDGFAEVKKTREEAGLMGDGNLRGSGDRNYEIIAELVAVHAAGDSVLGWK